MFSKILLITQLGSRGVRWPGLFAFVLAIFLLPACGGGASQERLDTSVVENPATASGTGAQDAMPEMTFDKLEHDFGRILQGEMLTFAFRFRNTGGKPLVIAKVSSSCGCTVADYPRDPMLPGSEGYIKVTFDSNNRRGFQRQSVTVLSNTQPNTTTLRVNAQVVSTSD